MSDSSGPDGSGSFFQGFSRQEYCSGLPCPPPGDLPNPGIEPASLMSPALAGKLFTTSTIWKAIFIMELDLILYNVNSAVDPKVEPLKGDRICHPKIFHFGIGVTLR